MFQSLSVMLVSISGSDQKIWTQNLTVADRVDRDVPVWLSGRADDWPSERHDSQDSPVWWGEDVWPGMLCGDVKFIFPLGSSFSSFCHVLFHASSRELSQLCSLMVKTCSSFLESHISQFRYPCGSDMGTHWEWSVEFVYYTSNCKRTTFPFHRRKIWGIA